ncbi:prolipoprotein diacylglyceryl transferase [Nocardia panacis]|uniref:Phosphatidylglycerol--prolipoprotein diacylglyceryl transferase n=1 Tax=Nocardia panacis TaxID=2340916 RepID=A0A3A4JKU9_9NOCA|nr:prolipoprotein diacylglyceryl transferase [Nocardia panacis]
MLAYIPSPPQGVWHLGPLPLRAYAFCIIIGIIVAIWWGERRWQARGGKGGAVLDVAMFAVPFGLVGGRLYHVATDWQKYFGATGHPGDIIKIYQGGLGIWGAVFLGGIGAWVGCRVYRIPLPAFADAIAPGVLLAQAIGRLGNYFNQELYGRSTTVPWGLKIYERFDSHGRYSALDGASTGVVEKIVHPTFLYEMVWNILVVILLVQIDKRFRIGHGRLFALYVAGYCFGRFWVELMRDDDATHIAGIRINSFTAALVFLGAVAYVIFATKGRERPEELQPSETPRPWPWQLGALRAGEAESAPAATESAEGADKATAVEVDSAGDKSDSARGVSDSAESESDSDQSRPVEKSAEPNSEQADSVALSKSAGAEPDSAVKSETNSTKS